MTLTLCRPASGIPPPPPCICLALQAHMLHHLTPYSMTAHFGTWPSDLFPRLWSPPLGAEHGEQYNGNLLRSLLRTYFTTNIPTTYKSLPMQGIPNLEKVTWKFPLKSYFHLWNFWRTVQPGDKHDFPYKHLILCVAITLWCHIWHLFQAQRHYLQL